ncbi:hypothetical protein [Shewanella xiamenensis]|uniref:hypothetical protein n=1 Tax=Shewanella xiamenensis TaxID=332186 RepID=UPI0021BFE0BF|nr:hypothetical protein [Shewanella xiamenensis]MCT8865394.1 hypothetical protein [Shewanella xiamenensis]
MNSVLWWSHNTCFAYLSYLIAVSIKKMTFYGGAILLGGIMSGKKYVAPEWRYQYGDKPKGKRMRLLSVEEAQLANHFLRRHIRHTMSNISPTRYQHNFIHFHDTAEKFWMSASRLLRAIKRTPVPCIEHESMDELNELLNSIFSDEGWRWVRKEISQLKKRENKTRIELSSELVSRLKGLMEREGLRTIDEAIFHLLSLDVTLRMEEQLIVEE